MVLITIFTSFALKAQTTAGTTFGDDLTFLKKHTQIILLEKDNAALAIAPDYQGRVMTSTVDLKKGAGFGWINRPVIETGILPKTERKGRLEEHIHIFGGEERFWLGPEGGQFALFFKPGTKFEFSDWTTPAAIDTDPFEIVEQNSEKIVFKHQCGRKFLGTRDRPAFHLDAWHVQSFSWNHRGNPLQIGRNHDTRSANPSPPGSGKTTGSHRSKNA